jgi:transposase-like protein
MGWRETCAMEERMRLMLAVEAGEEPMAALCRRFGVSRRIGYKWLGPLARRGRGRARRPPARAAEPSAGGGA